MKFIHIADLHLGKKVNEFPMLDDQRYILDRILQIAAEEAPDGLLIAGDVYDKPVPSTEAVQLLDDFLTKLAALCESVFIINGNHDSAERLSFASRLMKDRGVYFAPVFTGTLEPVQIEKGGVKAAVYMLPFLRPAQVRPFYPGETTDSYTDAVSAVLKNTPRRTDAWNILIAHQFVTGAARSESEDLAVGGIDNVDGAVFEGFDYVALGHLHRAQAVGRETLRYAGAPLPYSFSEARDEKSLTVVELNDAVRVRTVPLKPLRRMRELRGSYMELVSKRFYQDVPTGDYMHITLTDEEDVPDALARLRTVYPNIMRLSYDNARTRRNQAVGSASVPYGRSPLELLNEMYCKQNNEPMSAEQRAFAERLVREIWEGGAE